MVYIHKMIQNIGYRYSIIILIRNNEEHEEICHIKDINKMENFIGVQFISKP